VSPYFFPEGGGLERYAHALSRELASEGEVTVLCATRGKPRVETLGNVRVIRQRPHVIISNTPVRLTLPFELISLVRAEGFDRIIAHTPVPFYADVASLVGKLLGVSVTVFYHTGSLKKGSLIDFLAGLYERTVERLTLRGVELVAVSRYVSRVLRAKGFRSRVRYPPVEERYLKATPHYGGRYVLFVGQLTRAHRWKNLELLLRAFSGLRNSFPDVTLVVVGSGDMVPHYRALVEELGIEGKVVFKGFVEDDELEELYRNALLLALPSSESEAFGKVVVEAMAFGTPVLVSKSGEFPIIVEAGKGGVLVDADKDSLERALRELLSNRKLLRKMGVLARRRFEALTASSRT